MEITEHPLPPEFFQDIFNCASTADELVGDVIGVEPCEVVEKIDSFVRKWRNGLRPPNINAEDVPYSIGSLWGQMLVRQFGWEWVAIMFHPEKSTACAVVSQDRSRCIYPFEFLTKCLQDSSIDITVALSFNMLLANSIPEFPPRSFENIMDGVRHIVPCN